MRLSTGAILWLIVPTTNSTSACRGENLGKPAPNRSTSECAHAVAMSPMPQQAVTKGYWKIENFRAHPIASSSRLVRNPASLDISLPLQGAVVPGVIEPSHQNAQEDDHRRQAGNAESVVRDSPRIQEDELDVEQNDQNGSQIELNREAAARDGEGNLPALEGLRLYRRWLLR